MLLMNFLLDGVKVNNVLKDFKMHVTEAMEYKENG